MASYSLKLSIENCDQTAADRDTIGLLYIDSLYSCQCPIRRYHRRPPITYRLATITHDWHTIVRYDSSRSSKVNDFHVILKLICDFLLGLVIIINIGSISHCLVTIHPLQTTTTTTDGGRRDGRQPCQRRLYMQL